MTMIAMWVRIDEENLLQAMQEAREKLASVQGELVLDFSSVRRINASSLEAMEEFIGLAADKGVKVVLHGVNVGVYKVLKLVKLASRFVFVN
ncbi:MAG TPA: STAS domain-containing protein [Candidatus Acidoferrum sp.]|nr:STAS domain-containing protein [Candidatus Acidoferrum sp.]